MKFQKYILCAAVALAAFGFAFGLIETCRYFISRTEPPVQKTEEVRQLTVEEITFPPPVPKIAEAPPVVPANTPPVPEEREDYEFNPDGYYIIDDDLPRNLKDFAYFRLDTYIYSAANEENKYKDTPIPPSGWVYTTKENQFYFTRIAVSSKKLSFETETVKGVSYQFTGEFVDTEAIRNENPEKISLKGHLIKLRDGKKIAEAKVGFFFTIGC